LQLLFLVIAVYMFVVFLIVAPVVPCCCRHTARTTGAKHASSKRRHVAQHISRACEQQAQARSNMQATGGNRTRAAGAYEQRSRAARHLHWTSGR
jgi:hypothetical protein